MFNDIKEALISFQKGNPIIVVDDEDRENEGDIVIPASSCTPAQMNFCATNGKGLICIAIDHTIAFRLGLQKLSTNKKDPHHTAFLEPIDATNEHGTSTGISAYDRSITAQLVANSSSTSKDFIKPGHLFPVLAKKGGLLERRGHTEAAVDLCKLCSLPSAAIICEIMDQDGTMMRREGLFAFALKHALKIISIQQIEDYINNKNLTLSDQAHFNCSLQSSSLLPTEYGEFSIDVFKNIFTGFEHTVLSTKRNINEIPLIRIHSECLTGDVFHSMKCDCGKQLNESMKAIAERGHGYLIYLTGHEGRAIGIGNKIAAYNLQKQGLNTYEANEQLGFAADARSYEDAIEILKHYQVDKGELITNNPLKMQALADSGISLNRFIIPAKITAFNAEYLHTKKIIGNHTIITES